MDLARSGTTVVCSIHQPRADIFAQFDLLTLLSAGRAMLVAPPRDIISKLSLVGFDCPAATNPADFVIDLVTLDTRSQAGEDEARERLAALEELATAAAQESEAAASRASFDEQSKMNTEAVQAAPAMQQLCALLLRVICLGL